MATMRTKEAQGSLWSTAAADWARYMEPTFVPMYNAVLEALALDRDMMLLDAGCGSGLFLSMAQKAGAYLHGIDAAPALLQISRKRLPGKTLLLEDLEDIPFIDETFDVVTAFNSLQYAGNYANALTEANRVTKRGGRIVIGIWGKEDVCEAATISKAVAGLLPSTPAHTSGHFSLTEEGRMEEAIEGAGLQLIHKQTVFCAGEFSSDEALQRGFLSTAPVANAVQLIGHSKVIRAIFESAQPYKQANEAYYMKNYMNFFIAKKV